MTVADNYIDKNHQHRAIELKFSVGQLFFTYETFSGKGAVMAILDNIQNYYELWVIEELAELTEGKTLTEDYLADVVCVALNHLPPRYIRHEVDMIYYLSPIEAEEMREKVRVSVKKALGRVKIPD